MKFIMIAIASGALFAVEPINLDQLKSSIDSKCSSTDINCKVRNCNIALNELKSDFRNEHSDQRGSTMKENKCLIEAEKKSDYQCARYIYSMERSYSSPSFRTQATSCYRQYFMTIGGVNRLGDYNNDGKGPENRTGDEKTLDYKACVKQAQDKANQYLAMAGCSEKVELDYNDSKSWKPGYNKYTFGIDIDWGDNLRCRAKFGDKGATSDFYGLSLDYPFLKTYNESRTKHTFGGEGLPNFSSEAYNTYANCRVQRCNQAMESRIVMAENLMKAKATQCGYLPLSEIDAKAIEDYKQEMIAIKEKKPAPQNETEAATSTNDNPIAVIMNNANEANQAASSNEQNQSTAQQADQSTVGNVDASQINSATVQNVLPNACHSVVPEIVKQDLSNALKKLQDAQKEYNEAVRKINSYECAGEIPAYSCN